SSGLRRSSAMPCSFIYVIYAISLSLYPFTERYAQPYFFSCLIRQVMATPTIPISDEENVRNPIDIRVDIIHPYPVVAVAFPIAAVEELTALRFRVDVAVVENASLRARIKTTEAIEKISRSQERRDRMEMKRQLASVQESERKD
nr:hypothetical protein [Tanacetum cinerariifolium]